MNLFLLDPDPKVAAQYSLDQHVRKIILEATEMLGYKWVECGLTFPIWPYLNTKSRHYNHPMSRAVREGQANFEWCFDYAIALCDEFYFRFNKFHKLGLELQNLYFDYVIEAHQGKITFKQKNVEWPRCFGYYKEVIPTTDDIYKDYQNYYNIGKRHLFYTKTKKLNWTKRDVPSFVDIDPKTESLKKHLNWASEVVKTWPEWKRNVL